MQGWHTMENGPHAKTGEKMGELPPIGDGKKWLTRKKRKIGPIFHFFRHLLAIFSHVRSEAILHGLPILGVQPVFHCVLCLHRFQNASRLDFKLLAIGIEKIKRSMILGGLFLCIFAHTKKRTLPKMSTSLPPQNAENEDHSPDC